MHLSNKLEWKNPSQIDREAGVGSAKTVPDVQNLTHSLGTTKNEKIFTESWRVSLCHVIVAYYEVHIKLMPLFIRKRFSMASIKKHQQWSSHSTNHFSEQKSIGRISFLKQNASSDHICNQSNLDQRNGGRELPQMSHLRSVKWWGGASVDWVSLPHPISGSRSLFSCLYTILCHHEPLSKHVQHTFPVTPWPIFYSCVNTVLRANRLYSPILVHSCFYLHPKGVGLVTNPPIAWGLRSCTCKISIFQTDRTPVRIVRGHGNRYHEALGRLEGGSAQLQSHSGHRWAMWPRPFWASSNARARVSCQPAHWDTGKKARITGKAAPMLTRVRGGAPSRFRSWNRPDDETYDIVGQTYDIVCSATMS